MQLKSTSKDEHDIFGLGADSFDISHMSSSLQAVESSQASHETNTCPVHIVLEEKLSLVLEKDGLLRKLEVFGDLSVIISDPDFTNIHLQLHIPDKGNLIRYNLKPAIDKEAFKSGMIQLREGRKGFVVGKDNPNSVLKWRISSNDENLIPLQCMLCLHSSPLCIPDLNFSILFR